MYNPYFYSCEFFCYYCGAGMNLVLYNGLLGVVTLFTSAGPYAIYDHFSWAGPNLTLL